MMNTISCVNQMCVNSLLLILTPPLQMTISRYVVKGFGNIESPCLTPIWSEVIWEWSEGCYCEILNAEVLLVQTHHKVHRQLIDLCNCWVLSNKPEMVTRETYEKMKLSNDSGKYRKEGWDQKWNVSVLWPVMCPTFDNLANKNN